MMHAAQRLLTTSPPVRRQLTPCEMPLKQVLLCKLSFAAGCFGLDVMDATVRGSCVTHQCTWGQLAELKADGSNAIRQAVDELPYFHSDLDVCKGSYLARRPVRLSADRQRTAGAHPVYCGQPERYTFDQLIEQSRVHGCCLIKCT